MTLLFNASPLSDAESLISNATSNYSVSMGEKKRLCFVTCLTVYCKMIIVISKDTCTCFPHYHCKLSISQIAFFSHSKLPAGQDSLTQSKALDLCPSLDGATNRMTLPGYHFSLICTMRCRTRRSI